MCLKSERIWSLDTLLSFAFMHFPRVQSIFIEMKILLRLFLQKIGRNGKLNAAWNIFNNLLIDKLTIQFQF